MMNKTLLITGGTKGIGRAILEVFAYNSFDIITCSRSRSDLDGLNTYFQTKYPKQKITCLKSDLSIKRERKLFCEAIEGTPIDVLINNTGVFIPGVLHLEVEGVLEQSIETNLYSAYDVSRAVIPLMKENKKGVIFNICSTASVMAYENGGAYSISKFALLGFSKTLREELKEFGVKVTSILPGATLTSSWEGVEIPKERFMPPEDIAKTVWEVYNLSDRTVVEEVLLRPQLGDL